MSVLTEAALRIQLKDADLAEMKEFCVDKGVIVTPSAKAWLIDHKIDLVVGGKRIIKNPGNEPRAGDKAVVSGMAEEGQAAQHAAPAAAVAPAQGGAKPEYMTALHGSELVFKDHAAIKLRGKADTFEAMLLEAQAEALEKGVKPLADDLGEVLAFVRQLMRCEVLGEAVPPIQLFGMGEAEIHERSHTPKKFFGVGHFMPVVASDGWEVLRLNRLRAESREVEIAAYEAFKGPLGAPAREDIVHAYNRLSSALYVMMLRACTNFYDGPAANAAAAGAASAAEADGKEEGGAGG